jgi:hypothetical protein
MPRTIGAVISCWKRGRVVIMAVVMSYFMSLSATLKALDFLVLSGRPLHGHFLYFYRALAVGDIQGCGRGIALKYVIMCLLGGLFPRPVCSHEEPAICPPSILISYLLITYKTIRSFYSLGFFFFFGTTAQCGRSPP